MAYKLHEKERQDRLLEKYWWSYITDDHSNCLCVCLYILEVSASR